ncbi:hypothetical protein KAX03_03845 [Candidatus Bathyarchaeota archaeon]|nr:hypothetical protein [Candidatus Bathyarchaeota archaeon]
MGESEPKDGRTFFILGSVGSLLMSIASIFMVIYGFYMVFYGSAEFMYILAIVSSIIFVVGVCFNGLGFYGFYRNYGKPMGLVSYIFSILILIYLFICTILPTVLPTEYGEYMWFYTYYDQSFIFYVGGLVLLGIMAIIFGLTLIFLRNDTGLPELSIASGIVWIAAGSFLASYWGSIIGLVLLFISGVMSAVLFLRAKL